MKSPLACASRLALGLLALGVLGACSVLEPPTQVRGNKVDPDALKEIHVGVTTRNDVGSLLGSPTARAAFDDNTWLYVEEVTRPRIGAFQGVIDQHVVALTFDEKGVLHDIKELNQKDGLPVSVVARATPSPGSNASFMQQLLGNVGRFNTGGTGSPLAGSGAGPLN